MTERWTSKKTKQQKHVIRERADDRLYHVYLSRFCWASRSLLFSQPFFQKLKTPRTRKVCFSQRFSSDRKCQTFALLTCLNDALERTKSVKEGEINHSEQIYWTRCAGYTDSLQTKEFRYGCTNHLPNLGSRRDDLDRLRKWPHKRSLFIAYQVLELTSWEVGTNIQFFLGANQAGSSNDVIFI